MWLFILSSIRLSLVSVCLAFNQKKVRMKGKTAKIFHNYDAKWDQKFLLLMVTVERFWKKKPNCPFYILKELEEERNSCYLITIRINFIHCSISKQMGKEKQLCAASLLIVVKQVSNWKSTKDAQGTLEAGVKLTIVLL